MYTEYNKLFTALQYDISEQSWTFNAQFGLKILKPNNNGLPDESDDNVGSLIYSLATVSLFLH